MSVFMISTITVKDLDRFQQYLQKSKQIAAGYGVELVLNGKAIGVFTDDQKDHDLVVAARFPDAASIERWHASEEYQAIVPLRDESSIQKIVVYESLI